MDDLGKWKSPVKQSLIAQDIKEFKNLTTRPKDLFLDLAIQKAVHAFSLPERVKMLHINDIFLRTDLDIWNKSPGLPWITLGYKTKGDIRNDPEAIRKIRYFCHRVKNGEDLRAPSCLAYVRSHVVGEHKARVVWDYPATITIIEAIFTLPLIEAYKGIGPFAYGYETTVGGMKKIFNRMAIRKKFAGLDFCKFDKTVPAWLVRIAFDILCLNIDFVHYAEHGIPDARKMWRLWKYIEDYFIKTSIQTARGLRFRKNSGIASGSYFTQLIESICNYILCQWMCLYQLGQFAEDIIVQGDYSLIATTELLSLDKCQLLLDTVGITLNVGKSQITTELYTMKFLGYTMDNDVPHNETASLTR